MPASFSPILSARLFICYTRREEFSHDHYFVVEQTTTYSYSIARSTIKGLKGEIKSSMSALGLEVEVTLGGVTETTDGIAPMSGGGPALQLNETSHSSE